MEYDTTGKLTNILSNNTPTITKPNQLDSTIPCDVLKPHYNKLGCRMLAFSRTTLVKCRTTSMQKLVSIQQIPQVLSKISDFTGVRSGSCSQDLELSNDSRNFARLDVNEICLLRRGKGEKLTRNIK